MTEKGSGSSHAQAWTRAAHFVYVSVVPKDDSTKGPEATAVRDASASGSTTSRRRFVRLGVGGALLLGAGGVLAYQSSGYEVPRSIAENLYALSAKEYLVVEAIASRMLRADEPPEGESAYPSPEELGVAASIDVFVARLDDANRADLRRLIHVVEHLMPWSGGLTSRFTRLSGPEQDRVLEAMETSPIGLLRGAFNALKALCVMGFFSHPLTWGPIGYDGPLVARPREGWVAAAELARRPPSAESGS
jgi:hypothetical protein